MKITFLRHSFHLLVISLLCLTARAQKQDRLLIYSLDVEGGQSTLLVSPQGGSLLVDTGWWVADRVHLPLNHQMPVTSGELAEESGELLREFFRQRRL